jgi:hypothetical protein
MLIGKVVGYKKKEPMFMDPLLPLTNLEQIKEIAKLLNCHCHCQLQHVDFLL